MLSHRRVTTPHSKTEPSADEPDRLRGDGREGCHMRSRGKNESQWLPHTYLSG